MRAFTRNSWRRPCRLCLAQSSFRLSPSTLISERITASAKRSSRWSSRSISSTARYYSKPTQSSADNDQPIARRRWPNSLVTLAIETSCDDTCVAILEKETKSPADTHSGSGLGRARLLFEERVTADNRAFGGIHPMTAVESHMGQLAPLVQRALPFLPSGEKKPDFVSVTRGPGMLSSLATGLAVAKGLAVAWDVPLVGVHHMQAHALTPRLVEAIEKTKSTTTQLATEATTAPVTTPASATFPYLSFLVSGGNTMLVHSRSLNDHRVLATAHNIAVGDLLDKCARAILPRGFIAAAEARAGRSLPYGALLEKFAFEGEDLETYNGYQYPALRRDEMAPFESGRGWRLDAPLGTGAARRTLRFDYSGFNGSVLKVAGGDSPMSPAGTDPADAPTSPPPESTVDMPDDERRLLARGTMQLAFEHLASRLLLALEAGAGGGGEDGEPAPTCLVVSGGVASNQYLRYILRSALDVRGYGHLPVVAPPPSLCTDNAAMIAWAGMEMYEAGWQTDLTVLPIRKWSMDANAEDGGILGPNGWVQRSVQ